MTDMCYLYHPKLGTKLLTVEESSKYFSEGWYDTPAKFPEFINNKKLLDKLSEDNNPVESDNLEQQLIRKRGRPPKGIA